MTDLRINDVTCVWPARRLLGEGAWWATAEEALYWVDIKRPAILRFSPVTGQMAEWPCPEPIGSCAPRQGGGMVLALKSGLYTCALGHSGEMIKPQFLVAPTELRQGDRFNDGKCHPDGSFWAGTMDDAERDVRGYFYRFDLRHELERVAGPYKVCNGPAFSPDGRFAYLTDSAKRTIFRCHMSETEWRIDPFFQFASEDGFPDGMTTDDSGRLWIAMWDGAKVVCLSPAGERVVEIPMPISRPTSCAFGNSKFDNLYVTSASIGLSERESGEDDDAGGLFAIAIEGARGWPSPVFKNESS